MFAVSYVDLLSSVGNFKSPSLLQSNRLRVSGELRVVECERDVEDYPDWSSLGALEIPNISSFILTFHLFRCLESSYVTNLGLKLQLGRRLEGWSG